MAIGAISAIEAAGKVAGKNVMILSIDGGCEIIQLIIDGKVAACCECNPRFGPTAFNTPVACAQGSDIPMKIINPDNVYDISNAAELIDTAYWTSASGNIQITFRRPPF
ncbi:hypothetical protein [Falsihalocynthiibacter arcticus]|uniref:Periplasmic binding protein domain-containing protein n=1 Tax=Falsihalocynthiibacter arcticus TaxID=1579316 RepID=A0A126V2T6_9RHOB|nr:hypothetical protein [Falsihalocynthiibacter arcticus]AML52651.1 hypothetical protein RC74_16480 [Falsihalocynthiibacter arcticus]